MFPAGFQTARLTLRPISQADAEPIFAAYARDPFVTRYLTWMPHTHIDQTHAYIARCLAATAARTYAIVARHSDTVLGAFDVRRETAWRIGYGYVLARSAWSQGLMTEALSEIVRWALDQGEVWRIGAVCDVDNVGSARVMEKAGLTREGLLRRWGLHPTIGPEPRDCFSYAKVR